MRWLAAERNAELLSLNVNRAHYQNVSFVLLKNGKAVARLIPDKEIICTGRELARALADAQLPENEARLWHRDLQVARKALNDPY